MEKDNLAALAGDNKQRLTIIPNNFDKYADTWMFWETGDMASFYTLIGISPRRDGTIQSEEGFLVNATSELADCEGFTIGNTIRGVLQRGRVSAYWVSISPRKQHPFEPWWSGYKSRPPNGYKVDNSCLGQETVVFGEGCYQERLQVLSKITISKNTKNPVSVTTVIKTCPRATQGFIKKEERQIWVTTISRPFYETLSKAAENPYYVYGSSKVLSRDEGYLTIAAGRGVPGNIKKRNKINQGVEEAVDLMGLYATGATLEASEQKFDITFTSTKEKELQVIIPSSHRIQNKFVGQIVNGFAAVGGLKWSLHRIERSTMLVRQIGKSKMVPKAAGTEHAKARKARAVYLVEKARRTFGDGVDTPVPTLTIRDQRIKNGWTPPTYE